MLSVKLNLPIFLSKFKILKTKSITLSKRKTKISELKKYANEEHWV